MKRVRILLIDDSRTSQAALRAALADDPALEVVGEAVDGPTAHGLIGRLSPDLITMDVFLRAESGLDLAATIMQTTPTPIVMVTAADVRDPSLAFRALQAGALEVCAKLPGPAHPDYAKRRAQLIRQLKSLAEVPVVQRGPLRTRPARPLLERAPQRGVVRPDAAFPAAPAAPATPAPVRGPATRPGAGACPMLLIGASTGGPPVLSKLLRALPRPFPLPIAIVQHMTSDFVPGFAKWLGGDTGHPVSLVSSSVAAESGSVYMPVADHHLVLEPRSRLCASSESPYGQYRPSIDRLFESAASIPDAAASIGVLLTGMGADGAQGLLRLRKAGARTFAQAPDSCAVASMPMRAIALDAAEQVLEPHMLAAALLAAARAAAVGRTRT